MTDDIPPEDIVEFLCKSTRAKNDKTNKLREKIISRIFSVSEENFSHPIYGEMWRLVRYQISHYIKKLSKGTVYTSFKLKHKGGRGHNHDFNVSLKALLITFRMTPAVTRRCLKTTGQLATITSRRLLSRGRAICLLNPTTRSDHSKPSIQY